MNGQANETNGQIPDDSILDDLKLWLQVCDDNFVITLDYDYLGASQLVPNTNSYQVNSYPSQRVPNTNSYPS